MTKASDNEFPSVLFDEQAGDPSTPASGFWRAYFKSTGLFVIDDAGSVTGPFGTGGGPTLDYDTVRIISGNIQTTSATFVDLTGVTLTVTTGARRCLVLFNAVATLSTTGTMGFDINIDGSRVGQTHGLTFTDLQAANSSAGINISYLTDVLTAASHTIKIQWKVSAPTGTVYAHTGSTPAILSVMEQSA